MTTTLRDIVRSILSYVGNLALRLRYDIEVRGMDEVRRRGTRRVIFLPSHAALIDPVIMVALLDRPFHPHGLGDEYQMSRPLIGPMARLFGVRTLPNMERRGLQAAGETRRALEATIAGVRRGENLLFYPSGRLRHGHHEEVRAASGTDELVKAVPEARIVLVRQTGLWGSSFSRASGQLPSFLRSWLRGVEYLLLNGLFFMPRRHVLVEFEEPADFPRDGGRMAINRYLEAFYNVRAPRNTYVPYGFWERGGPRELPEPPRHEIEGEPESVAPATRQLVLDELARLTGAREIALSDRLANDLGLDSLAAAELALWIEREFGFSVGTPESLVTVGDVVLAASGRGVSALETELKPASPAWLADQGGNPVGVADGRTIPEVFLNEAAKGAGRVLLADQQGGERTFRDVITALHLLVPVVKRVPGQYVGVMLPASAGAGVFYLAVLFAGKTPVMVNWTTGPRNLAHALDVLGVQRVITAKALLAKLGTMGFDLSGLGDRFLLAEDLRSEMTLPRKLLALLRSYGRWSGLRRVAVPDEAVVLFTSGSENLPKAVPLTHANILTNIRDVLSVVNLTDRDVLVGMLPPFHSFGITVTTVLPLVSGLRVVYHPNPTEASALARVVEAYRVTLLVGTPTFLHGIVRAARADQLASLRLAVTGAEKCPEHVYEALERSCPSAQVLEGYGITECSPVVSANRPGKTVRGSIGTLMPSVEGVVVGHETGRRVAPGETGILLVRGPSIFSGYLHHTGDSPFVEFEGRKWYRTGDLVRHEPDGVIFFEGRLKRFVKLGGEMISLPAIEAVLAPYFATPEDEGPAIAVETLGTPENPEIVLFTRRPAEREQANQRLRDAGLSPLHNVRQVVVVPAIPVLGTGKTDYRGLKEQYLSAAGGGR